MFKILPFELDTSLIRVVRVSVSDTCRTRIRHKKMECPSFIVCHHLLMAESGNGVTL